MTWCSHSTELNGHSGGRSGCVRRPPTGCRHLDQLADDRSPVRFASASWCRRRLSLSRERADGRDWETVPALVGSTLAMSWTLRPARLSKFSRQARRASGGTIWPSVQVVRDEQEVARFLDAVDHGERVEQGCEDSPAISIAAPHSCSCSPTGWLPHSGANNPHSSACHPGPSGARAHDRLVSRTMAVHACAADQLEFVVRQDHPDQLVNLFG
jgi:hypothetical protein